MTTPPPSYLERPPRRGLDLGEEEEEALFDVVHSFPRRSRRQVRTVSEANAVARPEIEAATDVARSRATRRLDFGSADSAQVVVCAWCLRNDPEHRCGRCVMNACSDCVAKKPLCSSCSKPALCIECASEKLECPVCDACKRRGRRAPAAQTDVPDLDDGLTEAEQDRERARFLHTRQPEWQGDSERQRLEAIISRQTFSQRLREIATAEQAEAPPQSHGVQVDQPSDGEDDHVADLNQYLSTASAIPDATRQRHAVVHNVVRSEAAVDFSGAAMNEDDR